MPDRPVPESSDSRGDPPPETTRAPRRRYVLLAALEIWKSHEVPALPGMCRSAEELRRLFRLDQGLGVQRDPMLLNGEASKQRILAEIGKIAEQAGVTDQLIFYFGGHGGRWRDPGGQWRSCLVPYDGEPSDPNGTCISMDELGHAMRRVHAQETVLILDCCHAGGAFWGWTDEFLQEVIEGWRNPFIMAAAGPQNQAWVHSEGGSLFGQALIQVLREAESGISAQSAWSRASELTMEAIRGAGLAVSPPVSSGHGAGIVLFQPGRAQPNPYKGLDSFAVQDAESFFGREREVRDLEDRILQNPLLVLSGESGSGKSSLLQAGLAARFLNQREWVVALVRLDDRAPAAAVVQEINRVLAASPNWRPLELESAEDEFQKFTRDPSLFLPPGRRLLLIVDQFEQFFIRSDRAGADPFIDWLNEIADKGPDWPVHALIGLRLDFYPDFVRTVDFPQSLHQVLKEIKADQLGRVITGPLEAVGGEVEAGLVESIKNDLHHAPSELALLQHALFQLWNASPGGRLTFKAYQQIHGIGGALQKHASSAYRQLETESRQEIARQMFLRLIQLGDQGRAARRAVARSALIASFPEAQRDEATVVLEQLLETRLLTAREDRGDEHKIEIAHEILLQRWPELTAWVQENAPFMLWKQRFEPFFEEWRRDRKQRAGRFRSPPRLHDDLLQASQEWVVKRPENVPEQWQVFIRENAARKRFKRRTWWGVGALLVLGLVTAFFFWRHTQTDSYQIDQVLISSQTLPKSIYTQESWTEWMEAGAMLPEWRRKPVEIPDQLQSAKPLLLAATARRLAMLGDSDEAENMAGKASIAIPEDTVDAAPILALTAISTAFHSMGKEAEAARFIAEARRRLDQTADFAERDRAVSELTREELRQSRIDWGAAQDRIGQIEDPDARRRAQVQAAAVWALTGHSDEAAAFVRGLGDPISSIQFLTDAARLGAPLPEISDGMLTEAVEVLKRRAEIIDDPDFASQIAYISFSARAELGLLEPDAQMSDEIKLPYYRALAAVPLSRALMRQALESEARGALRVGLDEVSRIEVLTNRSRALAEIAKGFAAVGDYRQARDLAAECPPEQRLSVFSAILSEYARNRGGSER